MGVNGNVDTICPFKTRTYADGGQAAEGGDIPMCTLRNFPQVTDHCIEWARDQFELLFVKLGKTCEIYLEDPRQFENDMLGKSEGSIFETRALTSMMQAASNPSIGSAAQLAFDFFHFLFRDRILDLQATYPKNARIITKEGVDKGPFWSEKKRYPTAAIFNPDDESHTSFLLSATCLFSVVLGVLPPKAENDNQWLAEYRNKEFIAGLASTLTPPIYVRAPIHNEEDETNDTSNLSATDILK
jgi:ubiquitin-activating enzyme E1